MSQLNKHGKVSKRKTGAIVSRTSKFKRAATSCLVYGPRRNWDFDAAEADAYAKEVIKSAFDEPGNIDVPRKVHSELEGNGVRH